MRSGLALAAARGFAGWEEEAVAAPAANGPPSWEAVRKEFALTNRYAHFGGLLLASHPRPVRRAIEAHRRGLDANPVDYLHGQASRLEASVLQAAAAYLASPPTDIALTDSTTMGLGLLYNGVPLGPGDEALTSTHDFFATHESLRLKASRSGATVRMVPLYARPETASADEIVDSLARAIGPRTRVVALTWVHSSTGVKLPLRRLADVVHKASSEILFCVDGVHGFGVEDVTMSALGCDFFVAGCHKWLFGPRGTGIVWGAPDAWNGVGATIPSFTGGGPGAYMTPGGFHSFEHRWALAEAFRFHLRIGKARIARRIHELNRQLKGGLAGMRHVTLKTPLADELSAGLVCFHVGGLSNSAVLQQLRRHKIIGTVTPYSPSYVRLAPGLLNTPAEVTRALTAIRALG